MIFYNKENQVDFIDPFISAVLTGIEQAANKASFFTMIYTVADVKSIEALQRNWTFAGFIVISLDCQDFPKIDKAITTAVSYIDTYWLENDELPAKPRNFIGTDEEKVSQIIADYLKSRGHKKILFFCYDFDENEPSVIEKRHHAFKEHFPEVEVLMVTTPSYQNVLTSVKSHLTQQTFTARYSRIFLSLVLTMQILIVLSHPN